MNNVKSPAEAVADARPAASGVTDTAYAKAALSGANDASQAEATWGKAHEMFKRLRSGAGENFAAFDGQWTLFRNAALPALDKANAALAHYVALDAKAAADEAARAEARAEALSAGPSLAEMHARRDYAAGSVLVPFWNVGAALASLAADVAATRPIAPHASNSGQGSAPLGTDAELSAALDAAETGLARVASQIKAIRAVNRRRNLTPYRRSILTPLLQSQAVAAARRSGSGLRSRAAAVG